MYTLSAAAEVDSGTSSLGIAARRTHPTEEDELGIGSNPEAEAADMHGKGSGPLATRGYAASEVPPSGHFRPLFALFLTGLSTRGTPDSIAAMQSSIALSKDIAAFIQSGISMTLASRDDRFVPSIAKGVGCRVSPGRDAVIVLVFANTAEALLRDVAHSRQLAAVFSQPSTNRTLQIKGRDVTTAPAGPADVALTRRFIALFAEELRPLGWSAEYVHDVFWHDPVQLVALRFTPEGAFQQTPGPGAGAVLCLETGAAG